MRPIWVIAASAVLSVGWMALGQTQPGGGAQPAGQGSAPTGGPAGAPTGASSEDPDMIRPLLPANRSKAPPLVPQPDALVYDETTRKMVPPRPPEVNLVAEGAVRLNRIGQLTRNAEGKPEFVFGWEGDVQPDPPMIVLPNRMLAAMEAYLKQSPESWFRVTYRVTQYYPRNYMLIEAATPTTRPATMPSTMQSGVPTGLEPTRGEVLEPGMRPSLLPAERGTGIDR